MVAKTYSRGWPISYVNGRWVFDDTGKKDNETRSCARCGRPPTKEGYDACAGYVNGAQSVCCVHGVEKKVLIKQ